MQQNQKFIPKTVFFTYRRTNYFDNYFKYNLKLFPVNMDTKWTF